MASRRGKAVTQYWQLILSVGLILWLATACQMPGSTKPVLKIGLAAPFDGLHRPLGYEVLFAVKAALQERNAAGGVAGHRVELVALNDFDNPGEAIAQAREFVADAGVRGVIGHLSPETTAAALPVYRANRLAVVVPWPASSALFQADGSAVFVSANLEAAEQKLQTHLIALEPVRASRLDSEEGLGGLGDAGAILLDVEAVSAGEWVRRLGQAGLQPALAALPEAGSQQLVQVAGEFADGVILVSPGPAAYDLHDGQAFVEAYTRLAGFPPGPRAALAYDATQILLDSLENALLADNDASRQAVAASLMLTRRQGVTGPIAFGDNGARLNAPLWVYQIEQGSYPGRRIFP
ncbi:MAG: ABC transporter substrate-binding protein [Anaerolineae bacterium]